MTGESEPLHGHARSEEDRIRTPALIAVGVGALVLFFLASVVVTGYLRMKVGERPVLPIPPEIGQSKIGMVEQDPFDLAFRGERDRAARLQHLRSYGWIDRQRGIVHLPIDRAMDLVVQGERARAEPAPPPGGATAPGGMP
jgi:hypothetical protein